MIFARRRLRRWMRELAPGLARLEAVARAKKRLARRIERFIRKVEDAA